MPRVRPEISSLVRYKPGLPIDQVAREFGLTDIVKLASNENPLPPFAEVSARMAELASGVNRYPDSGCTELTAAVSEATGIPGDSLWFGAGSSELLTAVSRAVGGPDTSFIYGWPSFAMYPINVALGGAEGIEVPLDAEHRYDLEAMASAMRPDTTLVFVCNPNNPTGTYRAGKEIAEFVESVPDDTLVVVDEAYAEYAVAEDFLSAIPLALERANVLVARTFSKMYGLAGLRVGYMVGHPETLAPLRSAQIPFSVNNLAQAAAIESLKYPDRVVERVKVNREGVGYLGQELSARGIEWTPTQANFLWVGLGPQSRSIHKSLLERGVIIRSLTEEWVRVTVGTDSENQRFVTTLDEVLAES